MAKYIYVISDRENNKCKIGFSKNPKKRLSTAQTYYPNKLELYYSEFFDDSNKIKNIESYIHNNLKFKKLQGEWFYIDPEDAKLEVIYAKIAFE